MNKISIFTVSGRDVEILYNNGFLAYSFEFDGKNYGNKVELLSKSIRDVSNASFMLCQNAIETINQLEKNANK